VNRGERVMADDDQGPEREWERGWDGHLRAQRRRLAELPLSEKIQWLEDAQQLLEHMKRHRENRGSDAAGRPCDPGTAGDAL